MKKIRNGVKVQAEPFRRDHELEACHTYFDHGYMKIHRIRISPIVDYGRAIRKILSSKKNQDKVFLLIEILS
jgi:hypothetical protein